MPINPPWRLDPFQMPVNVSWGGVTGVAVIYNQNSFGVFSGPGPYFPPASFHVIDKNGKIIWTAGPPPPYDPHEPHQPDDFGTIFNCLTPTLRGDNAPSGHEEDVVMVSGTSDLFSNLPRAACYKASDGTLKWIQDFTSFPAPSTSGTFNCALFADCDTDGNMAFLLEIFTASGDQWEYIGKLKGSDGSVMFANDWASNHLVDETDLLSATPGNIQDSDSISCTPDGNIALTTGTYWMVGGFASSTVSLLCYDGTDGSFLGGSHTPPPEGTPPGFTYGADWYFTYTNQTRGFTALQNNTFLVLNSLSKQGTGPHPDSSWPGWPDVFPVLYQTADEWHYLSAYDSSGNFLSQTQIYHGHQDITLFSDHTEVTPPAMPPVFYQPENWEGRADSDWWAANTYVGPIPNPDPLTPSIQLYEPNGAGPIDTIDIPAFPIFDGGSFTIECAVRSISMRFDAPAVTYTNTDAVVQFNGDGTINWQISYPYVGNVGGTSPAQPVGLLMSPRPMKPTSSP